MSDKEEVKMSIWIREDKTEIELNTLPATEAKAKDLGWKKKSK